MIVLEVLLSIALMSDKNRARRQVRDQKKDHIPGSFNRLKINKRKRKENSCTFRSQILVA